MQSTQTLGNELRSGMMGGMGGLGSQSLAQGSNLQSGQLGSQGLQGTSAPAITSSGSSSLDQSSMLGARDISGLQQQSFQQQSGFGASSPSFGWYQQSSGVGKMMPTMQPGLGQQPILQKDISMMSQTSQISSQVQTLPPKVITQTISVPVATPVAAPTSIPRQMGTVHLIHTEKGLRHHLPPVPATGATGLTGASGLTGAPGATGLGSSAALPPGVMPEHVTEELITETKIGLKKRRGRKYKVHEENYHKELELARADLLRAAECYKRGDMIQHDEFVAKALAHQKLAERHLSNAYA